MTDSQSTCISKGPYGFIEIQPDEFTISETELISREINIIFNSIENYIDVAGDINVTVFLKDKNENNIIDFDFEFDKILQSRFNVIKDPFQSRFTFTIPAISVRQTNSFIFKITSRPSRPKIHCGTINVDAVNSGYGFTYSYFEAKLFQTEDDAEPSIIEDPLPPLVEPPPTRPLITSDVRYNFYNEKYENVLKSQKITEVILPNINVINSEEKKINSKIYKNKTINSLINSTVSISSVTSRVEDYFEEYSAEMFNFINFNNNTPIIKPVQNSKSYVLFPSNYEKVLNLDIEKNKFNFPMYIKMFYELKQNDFNIPDPVSTIITNSIVSRQFNEFVKKFSVSGVSFIDFLYYCIINELFLSNDNINLLPNLLDRGTTNIIYKYFVDSINTNLIIDGEINCLYLGFEANMNFISSTGKRNPITNTKRLFYSVLKEKIADALTNQQIPILQDQTLMYEIFKIKNGRIIQRYYFINNFESSFLNFIDTQIKYDTEYTYTINKIVSTMSPSSDVARLQRVQIDQITLKVLDNPPVIPDVSYYPYKGEDSKVLINLNAGIGSYEEFPEIIEDADIVNFNNSRIVQNKRQNQKIKFKSDDLISEFEIFRLDKEPKNFADFKNGIKKTLTTQVQQNIKINSASFVDDILPNKKYYYIARNKDVHGNISNPTAPIELEIINNNGTIYMRKKEFIFKGVEKNVSKSVKRYIQIEASKIQSEISLVDLNVYPFVKSPKEIEEIVELGVFRAVPVWDKEYLLKLTSKTTGKKIDIKFKFSKTKRNFNI